MIHHNQSMVFNKSVGSPDSYADEDLESTIFADGFRRLIDARDYVTERLHGRADLSSDLVMLRVGQQRLQIR